GWDPIAAADTARGPGARTSRPRRETCSCTEQRHMDRSVARRRMGSVTRDALICGYLRTPFGRYGGALARLRPDVMAAHVIRTIVERHRIDPTTIDDVILGCANQVGEDNRNVARIALLIAGLPVEVP